MSIGYGSILFPKGIYSCRMIVSFVNSFEGYIFIIGTYSIFSGIQFLNVSPLRLSISMIRPIPVSLSFVTITPCSVELSRYITCAVPASCCLYSSEDRYFSIFLSYSDIFHSSSTLSPSVPYRLLCFCLLSGFLRRLPRRC